jgi:hypothetical protein
MSEDLLEKALEAMKKESVTDEELSGVHARVLEKLTASSRSLCAEFRLQFNDFLESRLDDNRRLLMEDHLSRCSDCRARLAEHRGEQKVVGFPIRRISRKSPWMTWAAAAAMLIVALYLGRASLDTLLVGGPRATVTSVEGTLHLVPEGLLKAGATISENQIVRTGPGSHAILKLADGSRVELNERTELSVHAAWSGKIIHLQRGDIIVEAAKQRRGYLRVETRDSLASVKGTIFAVSTGFSGSLVSVVEGSVAVAQSGTEVVLSPGEQAASDPALIRPIQEAIAWSPDAETYFSILASLSKIEKQLAGLPSEPMRSQSRLLQYLPPKTVVYGAIPNFGGTIQQIMALVDQQSSENPTFGLWWNSANGQTLKQLMNRVETITHLLGNEIVFGFSLNPLQDTGKAPIILAEILPGKRIDLANALDALGNKTDRSSLNFELTDNLLLVSDSPIHLQWLRSNLGQGGTTSFVEEIRTHYQRGTGWLLGFDMKALPVAASSSQNQLMDARQLKSIFLERREPQGIEENTLALSFNGPRMGLASLLANSGSGGAAEYLSSDLLAAAYVSTREPRQIFDELLALVARTNPSVLSNLSRAEASLGISFANDFAASLGTESAIGIERFSTSGLVWTMAILVNDPPTLERVVRQLVQGYNAQLKSAGSTEQLTLSQTSADGRTWTTLQLPQSPITPTWTFDNGYLIAASDRGAALRAISARSSGSALVWSTAFHQQLPSPDGQHPAGFAWLNTKGAFADFASLAPNPTLKKLLAERDPMLVIFAAAPDQIRAVSRTRLSGFIMDILLLQSTGKGWD